MFTNKKIAINLMEIIFCIDCIDFIDLIALNVGQSDLFLFIFEQEECFCFSLLAVFSILHNCAAQTENLFVCWTRCYVFFFYGIRFPFT